MMKQFLIFGLTFVLAACGNEPKKSESSAVAEEAKVSLALSSGHYEYLSVEGKDSSFLSLDVKDSEVIGKYMFRPEVSDGAVGDLKAKLNGTQIVGFFNFAVEGGTVLEQVYFELQGKDLLWKKYELQEDPKTQTMMPDTTKLVNTQKYVLR